jgi:hypothetical protein
MSKNRIFEYDETQQDNNQIFSDVSAVALMVVPAIFVVAGFSQSPFNYQQQIYLLASQNAAATIQARHHRRQLFHASGSYLWN